MQQLTIPSDFSAPKFAFGQQVIASPDGFFKPRSLRGRIVGMTYTSHDAALALSDRPGWRYLVETPAFVMDEPHHDYEENQLKAVEVSA